MNPAPGYKKYPGHRVVTSPAGKHVQVKYNDELIADTQNAVALEESKSSPSVLAPVVYYVPREDVKMERLERTSHHTYCPFKGEASYYSLKDGAENAVWSYEAPYDEMAAIKGLLAFYPDKVSIVAS
jgi:uncharacterized protein (DUF427 family)